MGSLEGTSICFLGCGAFGTAILHGVVSAVEEEQNHTQQHHEAQSGTTNTPHSAPKFRIRSLSACVRSAASARRIEEHLGSSRELVDIVVGDNGHAVEAADVVVLGCRPRDVPSCLGSDSVRRALKGKLLVSVVAGVSIPDLRAIITAHDHDQSAIDAQATAQNQVYVVRVMANLAAMVRKSITVATMEAPIPPPGAVATVQWIFDQVGRLMWVDPAHFDTAVTLCSSGPAFMATFIESLAMGALAQGIDKKRATEMAALMAEGTAQLVLSGKSTSDIRDSVMTPGGSTVQGIIEMEERGVRAMGVHTIARATNRLSALSTEKGKN